MCGLYGQSLFRYEDYKLVATIVRVLTISICVVCGTTTYLAHGVIIIIHVMPSYVILCHHDILLILYNAASPFSWNRGMYPMLFLGCGNFIYSALIRAVHEIFTQNKQFGYC